MVAAIAVWHQRSHRCWRLVAVDDSFIFFRVFLQFSQRCIDFTVCVLTALLPPLPVLTDLQSHLLVTPRVELLNLQVCRWTTALTALSTHFPLCLPPSPPPRSLYPLSSFSFSLPHLYICLAALSRSSPQFLPLLPSHITSLLLSPPSLPRSSSLSLLAAYLNAPLEKD